MKNIVPSCCKQRAKNITITLLILFICIGVSFILKNIFDIPEHISDVFLLGVFSVSAVTEGYLYGIIFAFISAFFVQYTFVPPYYIFDVSAPHTALALLFMLLTSIITCTMTQKLKEWEAIKAESELQRIRANLLSAVSHDLRTPLTTIYGSSSAILEHHHNFSEEQKLNIINGIKQDSEWLIRIVENLLSITRIDDIANVKLIKTVTVLDELIDSVMQKFKKRYPALSVGLQLPDTLVMIPMDAILIEQVLLNLLENAAKHATGMTELILKVSLAGQKAVFEVQDNGCGIDEVCIRQLFAGQRLHCETNYTAGIGLSVCATIIQAHSGTIEAENNKPNGAVFRFILPMEVEKTIE